MRTKTRMASKHHDTSVATIKESEKEINLWLSRLWAVIPELQEACTDLSIRLAIITRPSPVSSKEDSAPETVTPLGRTIEIHANQLRECLRTLRSIEANLEI